VIVFPDDWYRLGQKVTLSDIDSALRDVIADIGCGNLSYSGGIDSTLLLWYLIETGREVTLYTAVNDDEHPDLRYAELGRRFFEDRYKVSLPHKVFVLPGCNGDELVRRYYGELASICGDIITGDGIDELACGYYAHQTSPDEQTYHASLSKLQADHFRPLHENSGSVRVHIPYAAPQIVNLLYRVPLTEKVSDQGRKLIIVALAQDRMPTSIIERKKYGLGTSPSPSR